MCFHSTCLPKIITRKHRNEVNLYRRIVNKTFKTSWRWVYNHLFMTQLLPVTMKKIQNFLKFIKRSLQIFFEILEGKDFCLGASSLIRYSCRCQLLTDSKPTLSNKNTSTFLNLIPRNEDTDKTMLFNYLHRSHYAKLQLRDIDLF